MGTIPTPLQASEGGHLFTITLSREVLERMIRLLKPKADPSLVLALIGADFVPPPARTTDTPESNNEHVSGTGDVRRVEPGEEVEQQPQVASDDGRHNREVIAHPQEQGIEEAGISPAKEGGEGLEQPLPITEKDGGSLVESVERLIVDFAAQEPEGHVASEVEDRADTTVFPSEEMEQQFSPAEKSPEEPTIQRDKVMDIVRQVTMKVEPSPTAEVPEDTQIESTPMETAVTTGPTREAEQPLLTPEEVIANLTTRNLENAEVNMEMEENRMVERQFSEGAEVSTDGTPGKREVVIVTDEREETKQTPPRDEAARARTATVHMYQRRATREENPRQKTEGGVDSQARSDVIPSRRRRRLIIVDETDEEEDVIFTPLDALSSFELPTPPAEVEGSDERRRERIRKGKAIATPVKKKLRQASSMLVIQEGNQRTEEVGNEEEESLRRERWSKRRNDEARISSEQRPYLARLQIVKM